MLNVKGSTKVAALAASAGIVIALVGLCVPTAASAKAPSTKPLSSVEVNSPDITIATSTHHTLKLKLSVSDFVSHANPDTSAGSIDIQLGTPNGREAHGWVFQLTAGSITDHVGTSTGVVTTGAHQISPFGRIRLTFRPDGPSSTLTCGKTTVITRHVKVAAAMSFDTASAWGSVGSYPGTTSFGRGTLRTQYGGAPCPAPAEFTTCLTNVTWSAQGSPLTLTGGWRLRHGKKHGTLTGERVVALSTPAEADRIDLVTMPAPLPALTDVHGIPALAVTTSGAGSVGSATLASTTAEHPSRVTCNSTHHHDLQTTWTSGSYTNGTTPLTLSEQIEGALTLPDSATDGFIQRNTRVN